mgnify:CR=1 FL=1
MIVGIVIRDFLLFMIGWDQLLVVDDAIVNLSYYQFGSNNLSISFYPCY